MATNPVKKAIKKLMFCTIKDNLCSIFLKYKA